VKRIAAMAVLAAVVLTSVSAAEAAASPSWEDRTPTPAQPPLVDTAMAYDASTHQLVAFGGLSSIDGTVKNQTWVFDGKAWTLKTPANSPSARMGAAMTYDASTGQLLLFGGQPCAASCAPVGDTWTWNGSTWTKLSPKASPAPDVDAAMAYDGATGLVTLVGGEQLLNQTWTWNGSTWTERSPATKPTAALSQLMAYDPASHLILLISPDGHTWTWDGTNWTERFPQAAPAGTLFGSMAYDAATGNVVLFVKSGSDSAQTWTWDDAGGTWVQQQPQDTPPDATGSALAYDPDARTLVEVGLPASQGCSGVAGPRVYVWDGSDWTPQSGAGRPCPGAGMMAADAATRQVVLFVQGTTWGWNGTAWKDLDPAAAPTGSPQAMAYDEASGQLVLVTLDNFGSTFETWTWDGTTWNQEQPTTSPPSRSTPALAYDPGLRKLVLFGGDSPRTGPLADTWAWDGSTWSQLSPAHSPAAGFQGELAAERGSAHLILFGTLGGGGSGLTWRWTGSDWTQLHPAHSPSTRTVAALAYDPAIGQTVLFGGANGASDLADTWTWDGSDWTKQSPAISPPPRSDAGIAYDPFGQQIVMCCGISGPSSLNDTWSYGPAATKITYGGPAGAVHGQRTTVSAKLTTAEAGTPISDAAVTMSFGAERCTTTTSVSGVASCTVTASDLPGSYRVTLSFAGSSAYLASTDTGATFTVGRVPTRVVYVSPGRIPYGTKSVRLVGRLLTREGAPLSGRMLTLGLGRRNCTARTAGDGRGGCRLVIPAARASGKVNVSFVGDTIYAPASIESRLHVTAPALIVIETRNATVHAHVAKIKLRCRRGAQSGSCRGTLTLRSGRDVLARGTFAVRRGRQTEVALHLPSRRGVVHVTALCVVKEGRTASRTIALTF
jgi:hypothetical protein